MLGMVYVQQGMYEPINYPPEVYDSLSIPKVI